MNKFEVGEIAIIGWSEDGLYVGEEVEICSREFMALDGGVGHRVLFSDGNKSNFETKHLRKKKPPLSTWDKVTADTLWNPLKDEVTA